MKNKFLLVGITFILLFFSEGVIAQTTQSSFVGTWKMNPNNSAHKLSKLTIVDNGSSMTISLKKTPLKKIPAKYEPTERKLHFNYEGTDYFLVYVPANGSLMGYTMANGTKYADYIK
jgi:hypothetical protein